MKRQSMFRLWLKKMLGIRSPIAAAFGFDYMYDYRVQCRRIDRAMRFAEKLKRRNGDAG